MRRSRQRREVPTPAIHQIFAMMALSPFEILNAGQSLSKADVEDRVPAGHSASCYIHRPLLAFCISFILYYLQ